MILDRHYIQDHSHKLLNVYPSMCLHTLPELPILPQFRILFFQRVKWPISSHYCVNDSWPDQKPELRVIIDFRLFYGKWFILTTNIRFHILVSQKPGPIIGEQRAKKGIILSPQKAISFNFWTFMGNIWHCTDKAIKVKMRVSRDQQLVLFPPEETFCIKILRFLV